MADTKVTGLSAASSFLASDLLEMVADPTGTPANKKINTGIIASGFASATGADANTTMASNTKYITTMAAWATAHRNYTLPASPVVGDRVAILVTAGNATYELIIKGNTSQTINGGSAASEWSRLFITGECVVLRYTASNTWFVERDGRIPQQGLMRLSTSATAEAALTFTQPTTKNGIWTADQSVGSICSTSNDRMIARRAGNYSFSVVGTSNVAVTDAKYWGLIITKNDATTLVVAPTVAAGGGGNVGAQGSVQCIALAVSDYLLYQFRSEEGGIGLLGSAAPRLDSSFSIREIL